MGGIECVTCRPAPSTIVDIDHRLLIDESGTWQVPSDFDVYPQPGAAPATQPHGASAFTEKAGGNNSNWLDAFDSFDHGASIHETPAMKRWKAQEQALVDWWMELTEPGSASRASLTESLQGQRLLPWLAVSDAGRMIDRLRVDCSRGPDGPREVYGCLTQELRELRQWIEARELVGAGVGEMLDLSDIEI